MALQRDLAAAKAQVKWTPPAQFHITLKFMGDVDRSAIPKVIEAVRSAVEGRRALTLAFQGIGAFPDWRQPRVLWSRVAAGAADVVELARSVQSSLAWAAPEEGKAYLPHVTLGRVKSEEARGSLAKAAAACSGVRVGPEVVDRVVVYESRLSSRGAEHIALESVPLVAADR